MVAMKTAKEQALLLFSNVLLSEHFTRFFSHPQSERDLSSFLYLSTLKEISKSLCWNAANYSESVQQEFEILVVFIIFQGWCLEMYCCCLVGWVLNLIVLFPTVPDFKWGRDLWILAKDHISECGWIVHIMWSMTIYRVGEWLHFLNRLWDLKMTSSGKKLQSSTPR